MSTGPRAAGGNIYQLAGLWRVPTASVSTGRNCAAAKCAVAISGEEAAT